MSSRLLLLLCVLTAPLARAELPSLPRDETWLMVGPLFSSSARGTGVGLEASLNIANDIHALGVFGQAQRMEDAHTRLSAGIQGNFTLLGLELGLMHETETRAHVATTGLHVAPYFSFIYGSVGLRLGIPLFATEDHRPRYGVEGAVVLSLKLPVLLGGSTVGRFPHL
ncbi:hypothetical protein NR800_04860 [Corallococcus interemptor]|uniref:hypothetical protein n=1 Tax=Corallococcus TaxID=83461 RepID=UPI001CBB5CA9|nr:MULTISPECIES: hypothetical protein [unclassified Corallococcus]MBZ4335022.1 hypothetical protein [Corallococcus sp. AS-1-12]MBZ4374153.1 hypothetical protein [Corallococcus sp. AS-1-6]